MEGFAYVSEITLVGPFVPPCVFYLKPCWHDHLFHHGAERSRSGAASSRDTIQLWGSSSWDWFCLPTTMHMHTCIQQSAQRVGLAALCPMAYFCLWTIIHLFCFVDDNTHAHTHSHFHPTTMLAPGSVSPHGNVSGCRGPFTRTCRHQSSTLEHVPPHGSVSVGGGRQYMHT